MKKITFSGFNLLFLFFFAANAQENVEAKANYYGTVSSVEYVTSIASRPEDVIPADNTIREAKDKRSFGHQIVEGKDPQTEDDYFVRNRHEKEQSVRTAAPSLVFDAYSSNSIPTDPDMAVGPNHVIVVFNTGFTIYDKSGNQLLGQTSPNPAIFPTGGCCDLTASYDKAADRWVITLLGSGAQIAVSDGPNPLTSGWFIYNISAIQDYQKLSVWGDGYYMTDNASGTKKVWALERSAMLAGSPSAQIINFNLPGLVTSGFYSPQVLSVTDNNLPAAGGATVVYLQDDAWSGVSSDHIKLWTINVNWATPANSTVSAAVQIPTTPFISVFDNGSFSNLKQPLNGSNVDALQAIIMNQAQFRKFANHNSAVFNFVVDTDASSGERAGIRWYEFRQSGDNQPWSLYQEGTYTAPDGRHAWHASMAMDNQGSIGMGYTSMSGPTTPSTVRISSYFTGRTSSDPLGTMTVMEEVIANGTANFSGTRYGDYSKIDVDPADGQSFWFVNEYMKSGRKGVVGVFQIQSGSPDTIAPSTPSNLVASNITATEATLTWTISTDNIAVTQYNISIDGNVVGTSTTPTYTATGLSPLTLYAASVTAQDAAGNFSGSAETEFTTLEGGGGSPGVIAGYYFETGLDGWTDGGADCERIQKSRAAYEGVYSIRLRDNSTTSNAISPVLDLTGNTEVTFEFHTYAKSMENGEDFLVEFYNGSAYQVIGQYARGVDFSNGTFFSPAPIVLSAPTYNFNANNRFRIRCDASDDDDQIYFDQVIISGDNAPGLIPSEEPGNAERLISFAKSSAYKIKLYPNPAKSELNIEVPADEFDEIMVISASGQIVHVAAKAVDTLTIDVSQYAPGMYFVRFVSNGMATTRRFIKE